jgi:predicted ATPase
LEIIEQPELHLHPAAHADLAELFLTAVRTTSTRFLIETHSETLLLRLRRHVAKGLDPSTVAVYFVDRVDGESFARRIHIDPDGNLDYWPVGVFAEDYEETRALVRAQRERRRPDEG